MIQIKNFSKTYNKIYYNVKDINLDVLPGDLYGFIGHNGAGKTTTLKSVAGILEFEKGDIFIDGMSIKRQPVECKKIMAYIPDNPEVYGSLTGTQYINFICDLYKVPKEKRVDLINKYSIEFQLFGVLNDLVSTYSHGMKQKLLLIAAFIHEPKVLILDEPFVGLDPKATFNLKVLMKEFCNRGNCILFSTHVLEVAQNICNKIALIKNGSVIVNGFTEELTKTKTLEDIFMEMTK